MKKLFYQGVFPLMSITIPELCDQPVEKGLKKNKQRLKNL